MRNLLVLLLIIFGSDLYGQTDSTEKAALNNTFLSKKISKEKYEEIVSSWKQTMNRFPDLPLDQNGQVHYTFVNDFKNMNKEKIFRRVLEYLSINYGLFPANLYSNSEDGKIIFCSSFFINDTFSGTYTAVISIKDEKMLTEFINIGYNETSKGYSATDSWIRGDTRNFSIAKYYPVILKNQRDWVPFLNLFIATNKYFKNENIRLSDYSFNFDTNYKF